MIRTDDRGYWQNRGRWLEGANEYGVWFYKAAGSGIWLNAGRTHTIFHRLRPNSSLERRWRADALINHTAREVQWRRAPRRGEHFPMLGADLNLDTVQVQFRDVSWSSRRPYAEVVCTAPGCMHAPAAQAPTPIGACPAVVELRRGFAHSLPCRCPAVGTFGRTVRGRVREEPTLRCAPVNGTLRHALPRLAAAHSHTSASATESGVVVDQREPNLNAASPLRSSAATTTSSCAAALQGASWGYGGYLHSIVQRQAAFALEGRVARPLLLHAAMRGDAAWRRMVLQKWRPSAASGVLNTSHQHAEERAGFNCSHRCRGRHLDCFLEHSPTSPNTSSPEPPCTTSPRRRRERVHGKVSSAAVGPLSPPAVVSTSPPAPDAARHEADARGVLRGEFWAVARAVERLLRPTPWLAHRLERTAARVGLRAAPRPWLAMHLRRGASCRDGRRSGRVCANGTVYAAAAVEMQRAHGFRSLVVATDSAAALAELEGALPRAGWRAEATRAEVQTEARAEEGRAEKFGGRGAAPRLRVHGLLATGSAARDSWQHAAAKVRIEAEWAGGRLDPWSDFEAVLLDVLTLAGADGFVGKYTSNLDRMVLELMAARRGVMPPHKSLDAPWCFGGMGRTPHTAKGTFVCHAPLAGTEAAVERAAQEEALRAWAAREPSRRAAGADAEAVLVANVSDGATIVCGAARGG